MQVNSSLSEPIPTHLFRHIRPGFELVPSGFVRPRHAHLSAYVSVVLDGRYDQASYAGRMRLEPGDVLIQPVLDRHESRCRPRTQLRLLRLAWEPDPGVGGVYRLPAIDLVIRTARRDALAASALLKELLQGMTCRPALTDDWPDLLAPHLRRGDAQIAQWACDHNLTRETVSRGFVRTYGVSPRAFATEFKAREAWMRTVTRRDSLAIIASDLGYADQAHMTRAVRRLTGAPPAAWRQHLGRHAPKTRRFVQQTDSRSCSSS